LAYFRPFTLQWKDPATLLAKAHFVLSLTLVLSSSIILSSSLVRDAHPFMTSASTVIPSHLAAFTDCGSGDQYPSRRRCELRQRQRHTRLCSQLHSITKGFNATSI